jgi:hypothetical protein
MTMEKQASRQKVSAHLKEGDDIFLDRHTPPGLFSVCTRKFLVVQHNDAKRAISLTAWDDPAFSVRELGKERLEYGRWWGLPHLKLTTILRGIVPPLATGII